MKDEQGNPYRYLLWGCGALLLIPLLAVSSIALRTWLPLRSADAAGIALEERFGSPGSFTPDPHGEVHAERMEAFLNVRRSVMEFCPPTAGMETDLDAERAMAIAME